MYAPISDQAQEQIHAGIKYNIKHFKVVDIFLINNNNNVLDECILVYGHSMMVELFLKVTKSIQRNTCAGEIETDRSNPKLIRVFS